MAPKSNTLGDTGGAGGPIGLTGSELRFVKAIFDNMMQKPDADWDGVASDANLKDAKCAKEKFRQMSHRHGWGDQTASAQKSRLGGRVRNGRVAKKPTAPKQKEIKKETEIVDGEVVLPEMDDDGGF